MQYLGRCIGGYFPPLAASLWSISQSHLFREQLASWPSQAFSYLDFIWMGQPSSCDTTSVAQAFIAIGVYREPSIIPASVSTSPRLGAWRLMTQVLPRGSPLSGEAVCWPQGHTWVTRPLPWRGRWKNKFHKQSKKRECFNGNKAFEGREKEGWGMYLVRCGTWRCSGDVFTSGERSIWFVYLSKST